MGIYMGQNLGFIKPLEKTLGILGYDYSFHQLKTPQSKELL